MKVVGEFVKMEYTNHVSIIVSNFINLKNFIHGLFSGFDLKPSAILVLGLEIVG